MCLKFIPPLQGHSTQNILLEKTQIFFFLIIYALQPKISHSYQTFFQAQNPNISDGALILTQ